MGPGGFCGKRRFLLNAGDAPYLNIAFPIGALGMDDRDVGVDRANGSDFFSRKRTSNESRARRVFQEVVRRAASHRSERQTRRPRHKRGRKRGMGVLLNLERARPILLNGIPKPMQQSKSRIAGPRKYELARTTHPDHLIEDNVRAHANERKIPPPLPDDFMPRCKRHKMTESLQRHASPSRT